MQNESKTPMSQFEDTPPSAQIVSLHELSGGNPSGRSLLDGNLSLVSGVKVMVEVVVGTAELSIAELFELKKDSVLALQQLHNAPLTVRLDGKDIAQGTLVVVGENFGVRITDISSLDNAASA